MYETNGLESVVYKYLGHSGKILGSKTIYRYNHPDNFIIYNSKIMTEKKEEIWHGDLDLTLEESKLLELAAELDIKLYVLYESSTENLEEAAYNTETGVKESLTEFYKRIDGIIRYKPDMTYHGKEISKVIKFKISQLEKFCKKKSPLDIFYDYILKELGGIPEGKVFNPNCVHITKEDYIILKYIYKKWVIKYHPEIHEARLETSISMCFLDIGPAEFRENEHWMEEDHIYLIGDYFTNKNNEE